MHQPILPPNGQIPAGLLAQQVGPNEIPMLRSELHQLRTALVSASQWRQELEAVRRELGQLAAQQAAWQQYAIALGQELAQLRSAAPAVPVPAAAQAQPAQTPAPSGCASGGVAAKQAMILEIMRRAPASYTRGMLARIIHHDTGKRVNSKTLTEALAGLLKDGKVTQHKPYRGAASYDLCQP